MRSQRSLRAHPYPFCSSIAIDNTRCVEEPAVRLVGEDSTTVAELEARKQAARDAASEFADAAETNFNIIKKEDVRDRGVGVTASIAKMKTDEETGLGYPALQEEG